MKYAPSYRTLLKQFTALPDDLKEYFSYLPKLIENYPCEVAIAYLFLRTEQAQNRALYCGVVKLHRAHIDIAKNAQQMQHLTRDGFLNLFENIFGEALPQPVAEKIKKSEATRDKVIHGKSVSVSQMREAISDVLEYAKGVNGYLDTKAGFKPFGNLQGFKGRGEPLDKNTTRWLLKGLGFSIK